MIIQWISNWVYFVFNFFWKLKFFKIQFIFNNLKSFNVSTMSKSRPFIFKIHFTRRCWHIDSCNLNNITWWAQSCHWTFRNNFKLNRNMTNWYLISLLLDFDFLITQKFTLFCLKIQMSLDLIFYTFITWAFDLWSECLSENYLINFITTSITGINCDLHAWFNITASSNNTFYWYQWTDWVWFNFSHFCNSFFWVLPIHNY